MISKLDVDISGGVNLWADSTKVREDQVAYAKNIVPLTPGQYGTRPAMKWVRDILWRPVTEYIPLRCMFSPVGPQFALAAFNGGQVQLLGADSSVIASISLGDAPGPIPVTMVQWDGDTYAFTGVTQGARLAYANNPDGFVIEALDFGATNADFKPKGAAVIRDRFVYWGFDDGTGNGGRAVMFADRGQPLQIGNGAIAAARFLPVAGISAGGVTHCAEINTQASGSPNQSVVAVWTTDQMYMLLGEPGETGDGTTPEAIQGTLQQTLLTQAAGCVSGATVVQTPYGTIWAGPDDVWFMPFGSLPVRIGTNIRPALLTTPPGFKWKWHAAYDADTAQYRLAIFGPDTGPTEFYGCDHHWILDLSRGAPENADTARWYGPQEYLQSQDDDARFNGTYALMTDLGVNGSRLTFGLSNFSVTPGGTNFTGVSLVTLGAGDSLDSAAPFRDQIPHGDVTEYFVGDEIVPYDEDTSVTSINQMLPYVWRVTAVNGLGPNGGGVTGAPGTVPIFNTGSNIGFIDGGVTWTVKDSSGPSPLPSFAPRSYYGESNVIRGELLTREVMDDEMVEKLLDGAYLGYWSEKTGRLSFRLLNDEVENTRVIDAPADQLGTVGFLGGPSLPQPSTFNAARNWKGRLLPSPPGRRSVSRSFQFWMRQDTVFIVNDTNNAIVMGENGGTPVVLAVTKGEYTYAQLTAAIENAIGGSYAARVRIRSTYLGARNSMEAIGIEDVTSTFQIYFNRTSALHPSQADHIKCARLFQLLGFDVNATASWGTGIGVGFITIQGVVNPTPIAWTPAKSSVGQFNSFRLQFSGIQMRARAFRRMPT